MFEEANNAVASPGPVPTLISCPVRFGSTPSFEHTFLAFVLVAVLKAIIPGAHVIYGSSCSHLEAEK